METPVLEAALAQATTQIKTKPATMFAQQRLLEKAKVTMASGKWRQDRRLRPNAKIRRQGDNGKE
ncbi:MAG: hypothetical protein QM808_06235 [Steroidobacteraceae bacterium]